MSYGLLVFIAVALADLLGLAADGLLALADRTTITDWVQDGRAWAGWALVALQLLGAAGLAWHLFVEPRTRA